MQNPNEKYVFKCKTRKKTNRIQKKETNENVIVECTKIEFEYKNNENLNL